MAARYEIIKDFLGLAQGQALTGSPDAIATNPYWVLVTFPFAEEVTFERRRMRSYDQDPSQAVKVGAPLIITSDCVQLQVHHGKDSFLGNLQAALVSDNTNYLQAITPGNWCLAWMLQSEDQALQLVTRIGMGLACNRFMDGLKFVGRVKSRRKQLTVDDNGHQEVFYTLQAASFTEFEASVFYDPALAANESGSIGTQLQAMDVQLNTFFSANAQQPGVETAKAIPFFLSILLGRGFSSLLTNPLPSSGMPNIVSGLTGQDPAGPQEEAPYAYLVPAEVGALLGKSSGSKTSGILAMADIDEAVIGVQNYSGGGASIGTYTPNTDGTVGTGSYAPGQEATGVNSGAASAGQPQQLFTPDGLQVGGGNDNHKFTPVPVSGLFTPDMPNMTGQHNVWTILKQYLNDAVNEMYTVLRVNDQGSVVPTLIIRQLPFSSDVFAASLNTGATYTSINTYVPSGNLPLTRFLELPRWHVDPLLVVAPGYDIGSSDAKRCNFVHIYGQSSLLPANTMTWQITNNHPVEDRADIRRSGLLAHMSTVACSPADISINQGAAKWMAIRSDFQMGMHQTLDGTLNIHGVQAPIVPGDNMEWDDVVYHLETVLHTCQITRDGRRSFRTTLQFDHGLRSDTAPPVRNVVFADQTLFPAQNTDDNEFYDPGLSYDAQGSED